MSNIYQRKTPSYTQPQGGYSQNYGGYSGNSGGGYSNNGDGGYGYESGGYSASASSDYGVSSSTPTPANNLYNSKKKSSGSSSSALIPWMACVAITIILSMTTWNYSSRASALQIELQHLEYEHRVAVEHEDLLAKKSEEYSREKTKLSRRVAELEKTNKDLMGRVQKKDNEKKEMSNHVMTAVDSMKEHTQSREDALFERLELLTERVVRENLRELNERFGKGPHKVEFQVELPEGEGRSPSIGSILLELAPNDLMPHTVHLFLEQVYHKLWDGCHFLINQAHIVQAGPHRYDGTVVSSEQLEHFEEAKLDIVYFQEYSDAFPHEKYTVGISGRPGGPDFYINLVNNTINHGPGGQSHHDLHEEADPCFAKVVDGFSVIDRMRAYPTGSTTIFESPIRIKQARIVTPINLPRIEDA